MRYSSLRIWADFPFYEDTVWVNLYMKDGEAVAKYIQVYCHIRRQGSVDYSSQPVGFGRAVCVSTRRAFTTPE